MTEKTIDEKLHFIRNEGSTQVMSDLPGHEARDLEYLTYRWLVEAAYKIFALAEFIGLRYVGDYRLIDRLHHIVVASLTEHLSAAKKAVGLQTVDAAVNEAYALRCQRRQNGLSDFEYDVRTAQLQNALSGRSEYVAASASANAVKPMQFGYGMPGFQAGAMYGPVSGMFGPPSAFQPQPPRNDPRDSAFASMPEGRDADGLRALQKQCDNLSAQFLEMHRYVQRSDEMTRDNLEKLRVAVNELIAQQGK